ncbi:hypothetical protein [Stenotrophomonas sp. 24(2023)]|uniref:hypothetical protein n=1 Tax=Stenotrophomonas sp. 24(2023) TaxID=3068324 RepID=UPI0027DF343C|nr:hypothetical protein [Stenotrophomonas sp. 24(2023)]WMJ68161.1 hypothetical protein Q9R17_13240 [Stenotrophomonas sp. 24(2023)]
MRTVLLAAAIAATSYHAAENGDTQASVGAQGQGAVASIGEVPKNMSVFASSDCEKSELVDCRAKDSQGRQYVFFDGALSRISVNKYDAKPGATLPAGLLFGEGIEASREKASSHFRVRFDRGEVDGRIVYSSDFSIQSPTGIKYALELLADEQNKLEEVVQRTDF